MTIQCDNKDYSDIINLEHPTSKTHPRMSLEVRAAQFSPFAALTGLEEKMEETGEMAEQKVLESEQNDTFFDDI